MTSIGDQWNTPVFGTTLQRVEAMPWGVVAMLPCVEAMSRRVVAML